MSETPSETPTEEMKEVVLVVDDEKEICDLLVEQLGTKRYTVLTASNGLQAYEIISKRSADYGTPGIIVIICDWVMPEMDGVTLLQKLRAGKFHSIPFLLMSGAVTREQLMAASKYDPDAILIKPFSLTAILQKLEQALKVREGKELAGILKKQHL